jgi:hypothetical protein
MQVQGTVSRIIVRNGTTRGRNWTIYSVGVNDNNGETVYGWGFDSPAFREGALVSFEARPSAKNPDYLDAIPGSERVLKEQAPTPSVAASVSGAVMSGDTRQQSICVQTAFKIAAPMAHTMIESNSVALAANASKSAKYDFYLELTDLLARRLASRFLNPAEFLSGGENASPEAVEEDEFVPI